MMRRRARSAMEVVLSCTDQHSAVKKLSLTSPSLRSRSEKAFLCANSVMLCVSVVKFLEKDSPQRHGGDTENHRDSFSD